VLSTNSSLHRIATLAASHAFAAPGHDGKAGNAVMSAAMRHWRSDGTEPSPYGAEAMGEPFAAFPSWFLRIECDRWTA
jgi:hypothetical protein